MKIISTKSELSQIAKGIRESGKTIGLVPTMGALHDGHASLVERAVRENDFTFVSVFVNPTQFNNKEDLQKYPRNLERDAQFLERIGADYVFAPQPDEMYSEDEMNTMFSFDFQGLDQVMEGKMRPGHFNGVVQVVSKLFRLVDPNKAYFGEKDYQQLAIIHLMVRTMNFQVEIVDCPIVREESGLALSSRNQRLSESERQTALAISRTLFASKEWAKTMSVPKVKQKVIDTINAVAGLEVEYYEIVNQSTLQDTCNFEHAIGCVTVYCGAVRLIDNIKY